MNLVTEAWIPVVKLDGTPCTASLLEVFTQGREFADLAVRPHERIALMRLLICIAQAALDGPKDIDAWDKAPELLPDAAKQYLEKWRDSFELFYDPNDEKKSIHFYKSLGRKDKKPQTNRFPQAKWI
jgi:CRISPR system Cascade subunit CasA